MRCERGRGGRRRLPRWGAEASTHGAQPGAPPRDLSDRPPRPLAAAPPLFLVATVAMAAAGAFAAPLAAQQLSMARVPVRSFAAADSLRRLGIDVVAVRRGPDGRVVAEAVVSAGDRALISSRGWTVEDLPLPPAVAAMEARRAALGPAAFTVYRDFDDPARGVAAWLRALAASRALVRVDSIGASTLGRPILAAKVGPPDDDPSRPNVVFLATYHAREWAATETALRLIAFLADSLPLRPGGAALLSSRDVWVIPVVNPDGYQYTFTADRLWRKNRRPNPDGSYGVDLNRNHAGFFAFDEAGSSSVDSSAVYRGPAAESEPETRAVAAFHRAHPPAVGVSYHTYGGAILFPWGHQSALFAGDQPVFAALAGTPAAPAIVDGVPSDGLFGYAPGPGWLLYPTNGDYDGWAYRELGTLAFTVELTSGCCLEGMSFGFVFPDDEALLARVFRDNLPFALALISAAGDPAAATGATGLRADEPALEAIWPQVVVSAPAAAGALTLDIAAGPGALRTVPLARDSLGEGRFVSRLASGDALLQGAEAVRVGRLGLVAEVLAREGAEREDSPWSGFERLTDGGVEGSGCWAGDTTTLASPEIPVGGRRGLRLFFWTRHYGYLGSPNALGRVEVSTDGGASWTEVGRVLGYAPQWYPVALPLTAAEGASSLRLRFVASGMPWRLDAIAVVAGESQRFDAATALAQGNPLEVSANPVRTPPVTLRWPPGTGSARVQVFSFYGTLLVDEMLPADPGLWRWDLTTRAGFVVANGAYALVVTRGDGVRYRRRLFVLRSGS